MPKDGESSESIEPSSSSTDSGEDIPPLPAIANVIAFLQPEYVTRGTHALIYKVSVEDSKGKLTICLKLFRKDSISSYNREVEAYARLRADGVGFCIPKVLGCGSRTVSGWGLEEVDGDRDGTYFGILMEWLEG